MRKETIGKWKDQTNCFRASKYEKDPQYLGNVFNERDRDRAPRIYTCDCQQVNKLTFGRLPLGNGASPTADFSYSRIEVCITPEGTCVHCGYYATLILASKLGRISKGPKNA